MNLSSKKQWQQQNCRYCYNGLDKNCPGYIKERGSDGCHYFYSVSAVQSGIDTRIRENKRKIEQHQDDISRIRTENRKLQRAKKRNEKKYAEQIVASNL